MEVHNENWKKRCFPEIFDSWIADKFFGKQFFGFHKKNKKGKQKVVFQGESIKKVVLLIPYKWGYVESKNRIQEVN
jgi:hypothetical protein